MKQEGREDAKRAALKSLLDLTLEHKGDDTQYFTSVDIKGGMPPYESENPPSYGGIHLNNIIDVMGDFSRELVFQIKVGASERKTMAYRANLGKRAEIEALI